ncbi:MAG TPA: HAD hydrolase-like protein, partial [Micrococcaceae bacterium]
MTISAPTVLFDLDGTLVDPAGGISSGIAYALRVMDIPVPAADALAAMIGPKLSHSLLEHTTAAPDQLPELIRHYRSWYAEHGIAMGRVYPGVRKL